MPATYSKLNDGSWGLRISGGGKVAAGDRISVAKKSGEAKTEVVGRVIWTGQDVTLATIAPVAKSYAKKKGCLTDGDCSSFGNGRSCGGHDCDGY